MHLSGNGIIRDTKLFEVIPHEDICSSSSCFPRVEAIKPSAGTELDMLGCTHNVYAASFVPFFVLNQCKISHFNC